MGPHETEIILQQATRKNIIIPLLCQYGLIINTCVSKNDITGYTETATYTKKSSFFLFYSLLFIVNNTRDVVE